MLILDNIYIKKLSYVTSLEINLLKTRFIRNRIPHKKAVTIYFSGAKLIRLSKRFFRVSLS